MFPWIVDIFELSPYHFYKVIEIIVREEEGLSRDVVKHLNHVSNPCHVGFYLYLHSNLNRPQWAIRESFHLAVRRSRIRTPAGPNHIDTGGFLAKRSALRGLSQDWLTWCQANVTGWCICDLRLRHGASVLEAHTTLCISSCTLKLPSKSELNAITCVFDMGNTSIVGIPALKQCYCTLYV